MKPTWKELSRHVPPGYHLPMPTPEQASPEYINKHLYIIAGQPTKAHYVPMTDDTPAYYQCDTCGEPVTIWLGMVNDQTGRQVSAKFQYGLRACACRRGEHIALEQQAKAQADRREYDRRRRASGLAGRQLNVRFDGTETQFRDDDFRKAKVSCESYAITFANRAQKTGTGLYLYGGVGTGKTHLASCIVNELIHQGTDARLISEPDFYHLLLTGEPGAMQELEQVALLVVDDIGKTALKRKTGNHWHNEQLFALVNSRYAQQLPTVYTSNLSLEELSQQGIEPATIDRIRETAKPICTGYGESMRISLT